MKQVFLEARRCNLQMGWSAPRLATALQVWLCGPRTRDGDESAAKRGRYCNMMQNGRLIEPGKGADLRALSYVRRRFWSGAAVRSPPAAPPQSGCRGRAGAAAIWSSGAE